MVKQWVGISALAAMLITSPAAAVTDPLIEGAKECTKHLARYERKYGIPTHLLSAIASTESGRYHKGIKISVPWPWTINAAGKGYYYKTKAEAVMAAKGLRMRGVKSMDVGCMQVNLFHHPDAFASIEQAFEPRYNIEYAASFLRRLYEEDKSWKVAAAAYHSKTPSRGKKYVGTVYDRWYDIVSKLRQARLTAPEKRLLAKNDTVAKPVVLKKFDPETQKLKPVGEEVQTRKIAALPEQRNTTPPKHKTPRMNSIKVTRQEDKRENGIIVVRPDIKVVDAPVPAAVPVSATSDTVTVAQVNPASDAKVVQLGKKPEPTKTDKVTGPRFIFAN
ncbi:MAG: lytic transglycosylase domain-containing protein [Rickettsiales bacterium]